MESVCNGLKTQVESLREELKATQKAFRDKMDGSLAKLDGEWAGKMEQLKAAHSVRDPPSLPPGFCSHGYIVTVLLLLWVSSLSPVCSCDFILSI